MTHDGPVDLLAEILFAQPRLPNAACRGHAGPFNSLAPADVHDAMVICRQCPAMCACRTWARRQPPDTLTGVLGGQLFGALATRRKRTRRTIGLEEQ
jgi:hypothetical protein